MMKLCKIIILLVLAVTLPSCGDPGDDRTTIDLMKILEKEIGNQVDVLNLKLVDEVRELGEVYKHASFDIIFNDTLVFKEGWLKDVAKIKGDKILNVEIVIQYLKISGNWEMCGYIAYGLPNEIDWSKSNCSDLLYKNMIELYQKIQERKKHKD